MNRDVYLSEITHYLATLTTQISLSAASGLLDLNILSEDFIRDFFNKIYKLNLENINIVERENFPAIDLGDKSKKVAIQVTSDGASAKVKKTLGKFIENKLYDDFENLRIVILNMRKPNYTTNFETNGNFVFNQHQDIISLEEVVKDIRNLSVEQIKDISELCKAEFERIRPNTNTIANEIQTIMDLIVYLTSNKLSNGHKPGNVPPDPEYKIQNRFADHATFLMNEMQAILPIYGESREKAENALGMDTARIVLRARYLMNKSDQVLTESNGNPKEALTRLTTYFSNELSKSGKKYDDGAIRFFLIQEIINCNVFPNS